MSLPQKYYVEHMAKGTKYRASWLPDRPLKIGDVGKIEDGLFILYTTLEHQQIPCRTRQGVSELGLDYSTKGSYSITGSAATGDALTLTQGIPLTGKVSIKFTADNGIVFQMSGSKIQIIENLAEIETDIMHKYTTGEWPKEWVFISELVITDNATVIISNSNNNQIELGCTGKMGLSDIKLANPELGLTFLSETGSSVKILAATGLTPLYRVRGIFKPFLSKEEFRTRGDLTAGLKLKLTDLPYDAREL